VVLGEESGVALPSGRSTFSDEFFMTCGTTAPTNAPTDVPTGAPTAIPTSTPTSGSPTSVPTLPGCGPYQYFRWTISDVKNRGTATGVQVSEFVLQVDGVDYGGMGSVAWTNPGGTNPGTEGPIRLGDSDTATKWFDSDIISENPPGTSIVDLDMGAAYTFDSYRWTTANDLEERDPDDWTVSGSTDDVSYEVLHAVVGGSVTASRQTSTGTYTMDCNTNSPTFSPTALPTATPTAPTAAPTSAPTVSPTEVPTASPTTSPTSVPTYIPTLSPTTGVPTIPPVVAPTSAPVETVRFGPQFVVLEDPPEGTVGPPGWNHFKTRSGRVYEATCMSRCHSDVRQKTCPSFEVVPAGVGSDRVCRRVQNCARRNQYVVGEPTESTDRVCGEVTRCSIGEHISVLATATTDTVCRAVVRSCLGGYALNTTASTDASEGTGGRTGTQCVVCPGEAVSGEYHMSTTCSGGSAERRERRDADDDRDVPSIQQCPKYQYRNDAVPGVTGVCTQCTRCPFKDVVQPCTATTDRICSTLSSVEFGWVYGLMILVVWLLFIVWYRLMRPFHVVSRLLTWWEETRKRTR